MGVYGSPELGGGNVYFEPNMVYCERCGIRYSKKLKRCPQCKKRRNDTMFYNKWWFWVLTVFVAFAVYSINYGGDTADKAESMSADVVQPAVSPEEYKAACEMIEYDELARNPNNYIGKQVFFKGQVIQVQENGSDVVYRINVTPNQYGMYENTIYADYRKKTSDESRILENDIVLIYGKANGIKNYNSVLGNQISIPHLIAEYIELSQ